MIVELIQNLLKRSAGRIIVAVFHRVIGAAVAGRTKGDFVTRGCLGLVLSGFRSDGGPRFRVPFRVSVIISVFVGNSGGIWGTGWPCHPHRPFCPCQYCPQQCHRGRRQVCWYQFSGE